MKYSIFPFIVIVSCIAFYGCGHECDCNQPAVGFSFVGYTDSEVDSIKVVKFKPDNQFGTSLDSVVIARKDYAYRISDTLAVVYPDIDRLGVYRCYINK